MGKVITFPAPSAPDPAYAQTPELALLLAILDALPLRTRRRVSTQLESLQRARPGEATRAAAFIARGMAEGSPHAAT